MNSIEHVHIGRKRHQGARHVIFDQTRFRRHTFSPVPSCRRLRQRLLHSSQLAPFRPPQLPLIARLPLSTPMLIATIISKMNKKLSNIVVSTIMAAWSWQ
jgi:hypothetical protein